jgi:fumarate hydratase class II
MGGVIRGRSDRILREEKPSQARIDEHLRNSLMQVTALNTHIG